MAVDIRRHLLMLGSGIASLALLGSGLVGERGVRQHERLTQQLATIEQRALRIEADNQRLSATVRALGSPEYCEWAMRQRNYVRPGEKVLILPKE